MKKVLFISNIPTPYRNDFYNELGKEIDLTVVYEAKGASDQGIRFNWDMSQIKHYKAVFLKDGNIEENRVDKEIFTYLREQWDYIFVTNYSYRTEMFAIIYLKIHRIPYIMEVDGGVLKSENWLKGKYKKFLISGAKAYFSPSKSTDAFLEHYGAKKEKINRHTFTSLHRNQVLNYPLVIEQKKMIRGELGVNEKNMIVGVGQLIYRKGWDLLIDIAKTVNAGIYIIGDGELKSQYEKKICEEQINNIHFVGFLSNEKTTQFYRAADFFVLPTRYDIWGLVVNEALANGLPVITTTECVSGVELIKDRINGILVRADDKKDLQSAIAYLLDNSNKRTQMAVEAIETIKTYTIESMVEKHLDYMREERK